VSGDQKSISVENIRKSFGDFEALKSVSFDATDGSTIALLGPSGCGKTTMLRCIAGLEEAEEGRITIGGRVVFDSERRINMKSEQRDLGVVFQSYAIWPHMSVAENVGFPLRLRGVSHSERKARVDRALDVVGLRQWRDSPSTRLSGGQQQRVALARAVIHGPRLVLFDEPLSNLDAQLREQMRLELKLLQERLNFTAIYVTHDQLEAAALAKQVVIMSHGRIEAAGRPEEIFERPPTAFVARFLGFNVVEGVITRIAPRESEAGAAMQVEMTFGAERHLRGVAVADESLREGARCIACFRRERTRLLQGGDSIDGGGSPLDATILATSYLGVHHEFLLAVDGTELRAFSPVPPRGAKSARLSIDPEDCFIFAQRA